MDTLTDAERKIFKALNTPKKIQDFLNTLGKRTDSKEPIVRSPRIVLRDKTANCMEGALLAAAIFKYHGRDALILDLKVSPRALDFDHVVALFKENGHYGAVSKTSHAVLRYREPIYKNMRELALTYFHEYFTNDGKKNLRKYSAPFNLVKKFGTDWIVADHDLYRMAAALDDSPHTDLITKEMERGLRRADTIEIAAGELVEED